MLDKINRVLQEMTKDYNSNKEVLLKYFGSVDTKDLNFDTLYHLIVKGKGSWEQKKYAFKTLFINNVDVMARNKKGDTFIHTAIKSNFPMIDIIYLINEASKYGFDVSAVNSDGLTLLHTAIKTGRNYNDIMYLLSCLRERKFNFDINNFAYNDAFNNTQLSRQQINRIKDEIKKNTQKKDTYHKVVESDNSDDEKDEIDLIQDSQRRKKNNQNIKGIEKYVTVLTDRYYEQPPAIGREKEVEQVIVMLATKKKLPMLVGPMGVGKTAIVDELAYLITTDNVPDFLKGRMIVEINLNNAIANTQFRGQFEENIRRIFEFCKKNNAILFIDEFHLVYGLGTSIEDKFDMSDMIKHAIDRDNLKVIGATTIDEYQEYLANDALKRRFKIIPVGEPKGEILHDIIYNSIINMCNDRHVEISDEVSWNMGTIISILTELTDFRHVVQTDRVGNPDLVISIIDVAIAYAFVENAPFSLKHLILGIEDEARIYGWSKNAAINSINTIGSDEARAKTREKIIDLNEYRNKHLTRC